MDSKELQKTFSDNIKSARNRAGLSQVKLADKANLSVGYICDLESGRRWGTPDTFSKLADALGINPFELLMPSSVSSPSTKDSSPEDIIKMRAALTALGEFITNYRNVSTYG